MQPLSRNHSDLDPMSWLILRLSWRLWSICSLISIYVTLIGYPECAWLSTFVRSRLIFPPILIFFSGPYSYRHTILSFFVNFTDNRNRITDYSCCCLVHSVNGAAILKRHSIISTQKTVEINQIQILFISATFFSAANINFEVN